MFTHWKASNRATFVAHSLILVAVLNISFANAAATVTADDYARAERFLKLV